MSSIDTENGSTGLRDHLEAAMAGRPYQQPHDDLTPALLAIVGEFGDSKQDFNLVVEEMRRLIKKNPQRYLGGTGSGIRLERLYKDAGGRDDAMADNRGEVDASAYSPASPHLDRDYPGRRGIPPQDRRGSVRASILAAIKESANHV